MRYPGEVYDLPPDARAGGDPKRRPHVLLANCGDGAEHATFAYCSTRNTEAAYGASYHLVDPVRTSFRRTGFAEPTYVYTSRLVPMLSGELGDASGRLIDDMVMVRDSLRQALGLGTGTYAGSGPAGGSPRGTIALFAPALAEELDTSHGMLVTEPQYARALRYQTVIPLYLSADMEPEDDDVIIDSQSAVGQEIMAGQESFAAISCICTVFQPHELRACLLPGVDDGTMSAIDAALTRKFEL